MIRLKHIILSILLAVAFGATGQTYVIDSVCIGSERHYRIDGELNSTYQWSLTNPVGNIVTLPETADTVTIAWNMTAGEYILSVIQTSEHGCDSIELGVIRVFELPLADAGEDISLCSGLPYTFEGVTASEYMSLQWASSGDGTFDDPAALNPTYTFGPNDLMLGSVTLTLKATGFGRNGSCPPAESSVTITLNSLAAIISSSDITCHGMLDGEINISGVQGGSGNYEYSIDGGASWHTSGTFTGLAAGPYDVWVSDADKTGCSEYIGTVNITDPPIIVASANNVSSTCGQANGKITITSAGGTGSHEYMIVGLTTWQSSNEFTALPSGVYTVLVKDSLGCEISLANTTVPASDGPSITEVSCTPATDGQANGNAEVIAESPYTPLVYSMDGITWQSSNTFTNLTPATYTAYVKDASGCITSLEFQIQNLINGLVELMADRLIGCVNTSMNIPVYAYDFTGVSAFTIILSFDPGVIEFTGLSNFNQAVDPTMVTTTFTYPGVLEISYASSGPTNIPGGEQLFSFGFNTIAQGNTELEWQYLQCRIYAAQGYEIPAIFTPGLATVLPSPVIYTEGTGVYCEEDVLTLHAGSLDNQQVQFEWTGPSGFKFNGSDWQLGRLGLNDEGNYQLVATNADFCSTTKLINVSINPKPVIHIGYSDTICYGQQVLLDPGSGYESYLWQDGSNDESQLVYEEGIYWVQVVDTNSCRAYDSVMVMPCNIELLVPNAFTPNGDGLNDIFRPFFNGFEPTKYNMSIYTKWGQLIFSSSDLNEGWDGTIDGVPAPISVYVYMLSYEAPSYVTRAIPSPVTGNVSIIK